MDESLFVIWSIEHTAWWRPGECGYTTRLVEAGRYPRWRAAEIVSDANIVSFNECMIPLACLADPPTGAAQRADVL
jgi:hypothetical protein